jgi:hypothetical protein
MSVRTVGALAASLALAARGLVGGAAGAAPHSAKTAAPVAVSIDDHRNVTMPTTIQPGVNEFHITSAKPSGFQLVMPVAGYTEEEAAADIEAGLDNGKVGSIKRFEKHVTLFGGATSTPATAGTLFVDLPAGTYWAADVRRRVTSFFTFTVAGADTGAAMPTGDAKLKAVDSTSWAKRPTSMPRKGLLTFTNRADQNHFLVMVKLQRGKTIRDFKAFIENGFEGRPPLNFRAALDAGVISPDQSIAFNYRLPRGQYVMMCFWPDASEHGMPHVLMGMYRAIKVG